MDQATRDNKNKLDYTILPWEVVGEVVKVFTFGAAKYTRDNYQKGDGLPLANYHQSAMRHMAASMQGEELDPESQLDHMAHVATNALMYLWQKQHEAKKPEMVDKNCWHCGFPFIAPKDTSVDCFSCGAINPKQPIDDVEESIAVENTLTPFGESLKLLRELADMQNDAPLERYRKEWAETMQAVYKFLTDWEEPDNSDTKAVVERCNTCMGVTTKLVHMNCTQIECSHCGRVIKI